MGSATKCLAAFRKVGHADDKKAVTARMGALRADGKGVAEAARMAVDEQIAEVRKALDALPAETGRDGAAKAGAARPNRRTKAAQAAADGRRASLESYFTPGSIVKGHGGGFDEVLELKLTEDGGFSVRVQEVTKSQGSGQWVRIGKPQDARWHSTFPEARELKAGPAAGPLPSLRVLNPPI